MLIVGHETKPPRASRKESPMSDGLGEEPGPHPVVGEAHNLHALVHKQTVGGAPFGKGRLRHLSLWLRLEKAYALLSTQKTNSHMLAKSECN